VVLRLLFPLPSLWEVGPAFVAILALAGIVPPSVGAWAGICYAASAIFWVVVYAYIDQPLVYVLFHPLASLVVFWIFARAAWRGAHVEWRGRRYVSQ
jgi:hypothetical protein